MINMDKEMINMDKETAWKQKRLGLITASELAALDSKSGKIGETALSYIRSKRWERNHGFSLPVSSYAMELGHICEPYAIEWYRANYPQSKIIYAQEVPEAIPFWTNPAVPNFGASPDAFSPDEMIVVEVKNVVSNGQREFYFDPATSFLEKKAKAWDEHGAQIVGEMLSNPKVILVRLLKYCAQIDDVLQDTDSPLAPWRGIVFEFERKDYEASLAVLAERIKLFNAFIASDINPSEFKKGEWYVDDNGQLLKK